MVQTITPVVHGGSRRRWAGSMALHLTGATLAAALTGALIGGVGSLLGAPWGRIGTGIVVIVALAYAAREIFRLPIPILDMERQVPEWWRGSFGPRVAAFLYGLGLGPGFLTHLRHGTFVAASLVVAAIGEPLLGALVLAPFGFARAAGVSFFSAARTETAVMAAGEKLERLGAGNVPRLVNAISLLALAVAAALTTLPDNGGDSWLWTAFLAVTFGWAAVAKLIGRESWKNALAAHRFPRGLERLAAPLTPFAEGAVAVMLLAGLVRPAAAAALILLATFSATLIRAQALGEGRLHCGCFGGRKRRSVSWLLARNAALALVASVTFLTNARIPFPGAPGAAELFPAVLVGLGAFLAVALVWRARSLTST